MTIYRPPAIDIQPDVILYRGHVFEVEWPDGTKTKHVCGDRGGEGRVSSPIQSGAGDTYVTRSGRMYRIETEGTTMDAEYVKGHWLALNGLTTVQRHKRPSKQYAAGRPKSQWQTVSMHAGLAEALQAWEVLTSTQTAAGDPSEAVLDPICVNAHDRCYGGAGGPCPYCENLR